MALSAVLHYFLILLFVTSVLCQSGEEFISIDCGYDGEPYRDNRGVLYSSDEGYVGTGVNRKVSPDFDLSNYEKRHGNLRSFPNGTRNCYTLPVGAGKKYLVRAHFVYGNYDGLNQPPTMDLYLGVHFWETVRAVDNYKEILVIAPASSMKVCLVKTDSGTPFISVLELRPLLDNMYPLVNVSSSLVLHQYRFNYGGIETSYPYDPQDRLWHSPSNLNTDWKNLSIDSNTQVKPESSGMFPVPQVVIGTAVTTSVSQNLSVTISSNVGDKIYLTMHFAELQQLEFNESRVFYLYYSDTDLWLKEPYRPKYLQADIVYTSKPGNGGTTTYNLVAIGNSTLGPILNALEVFRMQQITQLPTDEGDVSAIMNIKQLYQVGKNWDEGDPCAPQQFTWEGVSCSSDASSQKLRISSLNLSSSKLKGPIPDSLANLTALKNLDLSHNDLTGEIPWFLVELPVLRDLNLMNNQLTGVVPQPLIKRSQDGSLRLRIEGNPCLGHSNSTIGNCNDPPPSPSPKKPVAIVAAAVAAFVLLIVIALSVLIIRARKRRRKRINTEQGMSSTGSIAATVEGSSTDGRRKGIGQGSEESVQPAAEIEKSYRITFSEIADMTSNFERVIGQGGFGVVYHGLFPRGGAPQREVAVKLLSSSSSQGAKEFQNEARLLTRIHHKNLVSLFGYCTDDNRLALIYEFMPQGSLAHHLSAGRDVAPPLAWRTRLSIAADVAQGLDYLHNGCNPPIIHRDVKTANILLDESMGAKLSDFGLSRDYSSDAVIHITTAIAGSQGYLDPEYFKTFRLNEKSDVYSFGVVLLELITGEAPVSTDTENRHIAEKVRSGVSRGDQLPSIADHRMRGDYDTKSMWEAVVLALACTVQSSAKRPTMGEVLFQLKQCRATEVARLAAL